MDSLSPLVSRAALVLAIAAAGLPASAATDAKSVCTVRNADAGMRQTVPVDMPPVAQQEGLTGEVLVQFDLDSRGIARHAVVVRSSGWPALDNAARVAALRQDYKPEIHDCDPVGGTYRVIVDFTPQAD